MSGGEPSSIKRWSPGAAVSPHLYAKQRSRGAPRAGPCLVYAQIFCRGWPHCTVRCTASGGRARCLRRSWARKHITDTASAEPGGRRAHTGHAYLFTGTRGTGKTTCARILAKAVNCLDTTGGRRALRRMRGLPRPWMRAPRWMSSELDAACNNGVDDRSVTLREEAAYTACRAASISGCISSTRCTCCLPRRSMPC